MFVIQWRGGGGVPFRVKTTTALAIDRYLGHAVEKEHRSYLSRRITKPKKPSTFIFLVNAMYINIRQFHTPLFSFYFLL